MHLRLLVVLLCVGLNLAYAAAQETIVVGQIFDKQTNEPIPYSNIYFKNTTIGTASGDDGFFMLRTQMKHTGILEVSAIGYKSQRYKIGIGQYAGIQVELEEDNIALQEVFVLPGTNPAWDLVKRVRENRYQNDGMIRADLQMTTDDYTQVFVSELTSRNLQRNFWRKLSPGLITTNDSSYLLPIYQDEKRYVRDSKQKQLLEQGETKTAILPYENYAVLLSPLDASPNFYNNTVPLLGKQFASPLSSTGNRFYQYFLIDSTATPAGKFYTIRFKSRNVHNLAFNGEMTIDSSTCALMSIQASVPRSANINFLSEITMSQTYAPENGFYCLANERVSVLLDYATRVDSTRTTPTLLAVRSSTAKALLPANEQNNALSPPLMPQNIAASIDSLNHTPFMRFAQWFGTTLTTFYAPAGYIDVGNIVQLISFNSVEKVRLGIPIRTSEKLMKNFCVGGYACYGFRDKAWKYMGQFQYQTPTKLRHMVGLQYTDDYVRPEINLFNTFVLEHSIARGNMDLATGLIGFKPQHNYARNRDLRLYTYNDLNANVETKLYLHTGLMSYPQDGNYNDALSRNYQWPSFRYNSVMASVRLSWGDTKVHAHMLRHYVYNDKPVLHMGAELGNYKMPSSDSYHTYAKLHGTIQQNIPLGMLGNMHYLVETGCVIGDVPYPLLQIFHGNETYAFDRYRFTLMNNMEYIADCYATLHMRWNMGGLLFNQIPGINRLKLRELFALKSAYGVMRGHHTDVLALPQGTSVMNQPYVEVGAGIGNILQCINIMSVWRLTNRNSNISPNKWGIRLQIDLGL